MYGFDSFFDPLLEDLDHMLSTENQNTISKDYLVVDRRALFKNCKVLFLGGRHRPKPERQLPVDSRLEWILRQIQASIIVSEATAAISNIKTI